MGGGGGEGGAGGWGTLPMMSICQPCRRGTARERLRGEGRRHGVPIANPRCRGRPAAIHRLRTARMCLPDMVRMLCQQGAPGRRGSGVQDLVNSTKQFYSFSRSASFITHKAHLDAAGVVHGPHALHLLVHHLREPPALPGIRKDRRPCGRGWHSVSATDLRRGRSSSRGGRPAGRRTSGEEQKVTMVESMSTKRMDCACTGWRG